MIFATVCAVFVAFSLGFFLGAWFVSSRIERHTCECELRRRLHAVV